MSFSANVPIPYLGKGQLISEWSKDFIAATTMLKMDDAQRIQLLPIYIARTPGEKAVAESVSEETDFKVAIQVISKLIEGVISSIQKTKLFFDVKAPDEDSDCTSLYFELYTKGKAADIPTDVILKRFLTFFKIGDQFHADHTAEIKDELTKAESLAIFGKFKTKLDKLKKPVAIKVETEEIYHTVAMEKSEIPPWAQDLQNQIDELRGTQCYGECSENESESEKTDVTMDSCHSSGKSEAYYYDKKRDQKQTKRCKICKMIGHVAETCRRRICPKCSGKGHSDFECPSFTYKKKNLREKDRRA